MDLDRKLLESYIEVCESDEPLKEAMQKIERLLELNSVLEDRNRILMIEKSELIELMRRRK